MISGEHIPVLEEEVISYLKPKKNKNYIDLTVGGAGHAEQILIKNGPRGKLLGIDLNQGSLETSQKRLESFGKRAVLIQANYKNITKIKNERFPNLAINGILLDLGLSSILLKDESLGFSFVSNRPLDMRYDPSFGITAADILNTYSQAKLEKILREYGEDRFSKHLALKIIQMRQKQKFKKTSQLVSAVLQVYRVKLKSKRKAHFRGGIHPATRTFQALRIEVNQELSNLSDVLPKAIDLLEKGGRLVVISFHSLEDRIVKNFFRTESRDCICPPEIYVCRCNHNKTLKILTKKPIRPSFLEIKKNSKSRSAKLRAAEKL